MNPEIRCFDFHELRASDPGKPKQLIGYGAIFNSLTQLPGFKEQVKPGAFLRAIRSGQDVKCLWNHNADAVIGSSRAGTMRLAEDSRGLKFVTDLAETRSHQEYHESVRRGDVSGCSFGFLVGKDGQSWSEERGADGVYFVQRNLTDIERLTDCGPVTYPAYDSTEVSARSAVEAPVELRSAVETKNARINYVKPRNLVYVPDMPTPDVCRAITERAQKRHADERAIVKRRKALVNDILNW